MSHKSAGFTQIFVSIELASNAGAQYLDLGAKIIVRPTIPLSSYLPNSLKAKHHHQWRPQFYSHSHFSLLHSKSLNPQISNPHFPSPKNQFPGNLSTQFHSLPQSNALQKFRCSNNGNYSPELPSETPMTKKPTLFLSVKIPRFSN